MRSSYCLRWRGTDLPLAYFFEVGIRSADEKKNRTHLEDGSGSVSLKAFMRAFMETVVQASRRLQRISVLCSESKSRRSAAKHFLVDVKGTECSLFKFNYRELLTQSLVMPPKLPRLR